MSRTRASAKQAGASFERSIADSLAKELEDSRIDRAIRRGALDRGDVANVRMGSHRIVIECKNVKAQALPEWVREAQVEAEHDGALVGVVVAKRHGRSDPLEQWVHMTVADLVKILKAGGS